ncbi:hypothetical protein P4S68_07520 [Pseudoalteromonas sp. Hal099]
MPFYETIITYNTQQLIASADHTFTGTITPVFIIGMPAAAQPYLSK